jgi:predicted ATPase
MIKQLRIRNFKSLVDTGTLDIRPITILVGPNSSGKSSLIQFLLLLMQTARSRDIENPLLLNDDNCLRLESYKNIIFRNETSKPLEFEIAFDAGSSERFSSIQSFTYRVQFMSKRSRIMVSEFDIIDNAQSKRILGIRHDSDKNRYFVSESFDPDLRAESESPIEFDKFVPMLFAGYPFRTKYIRERSRARRDRSKNERNSENMDYFESMEFVRRMIGILSRKIHYIGPLREFPRRYYPISRVTVEDVGFKGERTVEALASWPKSRLRKVEDIVKRFGLGKTIVIKPLSGNKTLVEVRVQDPNLDISFNIHDVGFGISQVLPIIVEGFHAEPGSLILIEQPEIHLHPRLQALMGDLLLEISSERRKVIVETHSEHLIMRIQRRIAEGILSHEDVAIYFFSSGQNGTEIKRISFDKSGRLRDWPKGFFEEDVEESFAIARAMARTPPSE